MQKLLCILLFSFARLLYSGETFNYTETADDKFSILSDRSSYVSSELAFSQDLPDETPTSKKRKKRIKGISYEFIGIIPEYKTQHFFFADYQIIFFPSGALRPILFCYGKRGPPAI
jgi:hypothetical protein